MATSFVASATSIDSATIVIPSGAQAGDWAILFDHIFNNSPSPTEVVPAGWTQIGSSLTNGTTRRWVVSHKILVAGDPGATVTGMSPSTDSDKVMFVFRGANPYASATPSTWNGEQTTLNPASQTVSASGQTAPLIVLGQAFVSNATAAFSTASPAFDATVATSSARMLAGYKIYDASPSDHTIDQNDLGNTNCLRSGYVRLVEASASTVNGQMFAVF